MPASEASWMAQGRQKTPEATKITSKCTPTFGHQNDIKVHPEPHKMITKMHPELSKMTPKSNSKEHAVMNIFV
jgi:hypothetical protein